MAYLPLVPLLSVRRFGRRLRLRTSIQLHGRHLARVRVRVRVRVGARARVRIRVRVEAQVRAAWAAPVRGRHGRNHQWDGAPG